MSPKFYKSLLISPVAGFVVVRGQLLNGRFTGSRVTHSELEGSLDETALQLANQFSISNVGTTDRQMPVVAAHLYLVLYKIADGHMMLSFPVIAESGGNQAEYYGSAFLAVQGKDGKWTEIKGPQLRRR